MKIDFMATLDHVTALDDRLVVPHPGDATVVPHPGDATVVPHPGDATVHAGASI